MNKELSLEGFRMPGEWESQKSVWIIWPYNKKDWPDLFDNCLLYTSPSPRDQA